MSMPVLVRHRAAMNAEQYDASAPVLIPLLKQQPGFVSHIFYEDGSGGVVDEVWETTAQHDAWFDAKNKPNVPVRSPER